MWRRWSCYGGWVLRHSHCSCWGRAWLGAHKMFSLCLVLLFQQGSGVVWCLSWLLEMNHRCRHMVQRCSGFVSAARVSWKVKQQQLHLFQSYFFAQRDFAVKNLKGKLLLRECYLSLRKSSPWHFLFLIDQILQGVFFQSKVEAGVWLPAVQHSLECTGV